MRVLIVEDSREDLLNLRSLLGQVPEIEVVGEVHTLAAARAAATETTPDVVFLDIELGTAKLRGPGSAPLTKVQVYRGGGERHQLALEAVAAIMADRDYSKVICGSREYPDHRRFSEWNDLLAGKGFSQLDRSTLVRLDLVRSWTPFANGLKLTFRNSPAELELGRAAAKRFEEISANKK